MEIIKQFGLWYFDYGFIIWTIIAFIGGFLATKKNKLLPIVISLTCIFVVIATYGKHYI